LTHVDSIEKKEKSLETVEEFLAHAIQLEREAADRFGQLAEAMESGGNKASCSGSWRIIHSFISRTRVSGQAFATFPT